MHLTCQTLLDKYGITWEMAIRHPFLNNCKQATIKPEQFNTWLVQDYLFVVEFTRLQARTLAKSPVSHFNTLLGGLGSLQDELNWFKEKARERHLNLNTSFQEINQQYCDFMAALAVEPYVVQAIAVWAIELAYNQAWQIPGSMKNPYDEFANRWGNKNFTHYVYQLEKQADEELREINDRTQKKVTRTFLKVAEYEKLFWEMAYRINYEAKGTDIANTTH